MLVDPKISIAQINQEIKDCERDIAKYGWELSELDIENMSFTVTMISPIDDEKYIIYIQFDNYKYHPLLIDFIHPTTSEKGVLRAYPNNNGSHAGFFHNKAVICHPASRKAYTGYSSLHGEWDINSWLNNPKVGELTTLQSILRSLWVRISTRNRYTGRKP